MTSKPDPSITLSPLSRKVERDGISVEVHIFRVEPIPEWILEVVNCNGEATVWPEPFLCDAVALAEFQRVASEEGMETFLSNDGSRKLSNGQRQNL